MSLSQLFFKQTNQIGDDSVGIIELDVIVSESATSKTSVTRNPVENGADVTDHARMEPMEFQVTGIVSNTPVIFLSGIQSGNILTGNRQSATAWENLLELQSKRQPFTLTQGLKSYENVIITQLKQTTTASNAGALQFTANLQEVITVGVQELQDFNFNEPEISAGMLPATDDGIKVVQ